MTTPVNSTYYWFDADGHGHLSMKGSENKMKVPTAERYYWVDEHGQIHIGVRWVIE